MNKLTTTLFFIGVITVAIVVKLHRDKIEKKSKKIDEECMEMTKNFVQDALFQQNDLFKNA